MMKCGHAANATNGDGKPVCVICMGLGVGADQIDENPPDLTNRIAVCSYGRNHGKQPSNTNLAFFEYCPAKEFDEYYCGCRGWD